jgi:ribosome-associated protein
VKAGTRSLEEIVREAAASILDKKAEDVLVLDLREVSDATDYFIIATGDTDVHVRAIADHCVERLFEVEGIKPWHVEGYDSGTWVLLDYVDFVLHVFERATRGYYRLERLWSDAEAIELEPLAGGEDLAGET